MEGLPIKPISICGTLVFSYSSSKSSPQAGSSGMLSKLRSALSSKPVLTFNPNPIPPRSQDEHEWLETYLLIHRLSIPSYRYSYLLWIVVAIVFTLLVVSHQNGRIRGSYINGLWKKWGYRRRTWRKKHSSAEARRKNIPYAQPMPLPSNTQLLGLIALFFVSFMLSLVGPDYIAPGTHTWDLVHNTTQPPIVISNPSPFSATPPLFTISKTWWSSGSRAGTIAFALFPLCILFVLKAPPFAIFSLPFLIQLYNDKLTYLHRWCGRLIWLLTTLHVVLWTVQLCQDTIQPGRSTFILAFTHEQFVFGWLGFICLTLLIAMSLRPVRAGVYEVFYIFHIFLVPASLVFSALHFPPTAWWCWVTLILWGCERAWRLVRFITINGLLGRVQGRRSNRYINNIHFGAYEEARRLGSSYTLIPANNSNSSVIEPDQHQLLDLDHASSAAAYSHPRGTLSPTPIHSGYPFQLRSAGYSPRGAYVSPPGYAHATLLPGLTIRLRLIPPHHFTWAPGQHVLLTVPSVSKFTSHPFTISSICDNEAATDDSRELVFLIRARTGFTKRLWMYVEHLEKAGAIGDEPDFNFIRPSRGVLLRVYIDGPFGSSTRVGWTTYDSVLIIAGGSGISFSASILEYACMCLIGRNSKSLGGNTGLWGNGTTPSRIKHVRLVWIIREFTHIQWASATIRRCLELVSSPSLQIDIFVTNPMPEQSDFQTATHLSKEIRDFQPRQPHNSVMTENESNHSGDTSFNVSTDALNDESNETSDTLDTTPEQQHELSLTNFDAEDDTYSPGEHQFSRQLQEEGRLRREQSRLACSPPFSRDSIRQKRMTGFISSGTPSPVLKTTSSSKLWLDSSVVVNSNSNSKPPIVTTNNAFTTTKSTVSPTSAGRAKLLQVNDNLMADKHTRAFFKPLDPHRHTRFDMDEIEAGDVPLVSELARTGRPNIDQIVVEEASRSCKSMVVACCGPTALNAVVRKSVAKQIKPRSIMKGQSPVIDLVSEDFEW